MKRWEVTRQLMDADFTFNEAARRLVEREGYSVVQHFWRLMLEMDEVPPESFQDFSQDGKLKLDLVVDAQHPMGTMQVQKRTGIYMVRQYDVYEKELLYLIKSHQGGGLLLSTR